MRFLAVPVVALALSSALTFAQDPSVARPPEVKGGYQVIPLGESAIMVDLKTGQTWMLKKDPEKELARHVWVPLKKLTEMEASDWRAKTKKLRDARRKRRREAKDK